MLVTRESTASSVLFVTSRALAALDHFRVPCQVVEDASALGGGVECLRPTAGGPVLLWPSASTQPGTAVAASLKTETEAAIPLFARIVSDREAPALLTDFGGSWSRTDASVQVDGKRVASIWSERDGSLFLPFDPDEVRLNYLSEDYQTITRGRAGRASRRYAMRGYYRARGVLPRPAQIWLRRRYAVMQARTTFPRWPVETGLHDFLELMFQLVQSLVDEPVPRIASWPGSASWALVLTHDVETAVGLAAMDTVVELERSLGLRSSWNFVPRRDYDVSNDLIEALISEGFEAGVHGLYHDGRDLESREMLDQRLPGMHEAATRWRAVGFRSPATHRDFELMPLLGFDYDSSYPDTDPFEPQGGGCCTWLPFFNRDMVELPLTMPQDHTLFTILCQQDERAWLEKAEFLRSRGGMVLIDTHPDYLRDKRVFAAYRALLETFADASGIWSVLPRDMSDWWRRRAASALERVGSQWCVTGPAAEEARIEFVRTAQIF
jgi:peptidoglycan/xylan/chitin deacetylase (PgdA/CDA1 family)